MSAPHLMAFYILLMINDLSNLTYKFKISHMNHIAIFKKNNYI